MKTCNSCNINKDLTEFYKQGGVHKNNNLYRPDCKDCYKLKKSKYKPTAVKPKVVKTKLEVISKVCKTCKIEKNSIEFYKRYSKWYTTSCKKCCNNQRLEYGRKTRFAYQKNYNKNKKFSINEKISMRLRTRLYVSLKKEYKSGSAVRDLGCSIKEFKIYLENKFEPNMSWENYGMYGWHIDHIIPLSKFDLTNREDFLKANHYTNLQPLWAKENWSKGNRVT